MGLCHHLEMIQSRPVSYLTLHLLEKFTNLFSKRKMSFIGQKVVKGLTHLQGNGGFCKGHFIEMHRIGNIGVS